LWDIQTQLKLFNDYISPSVIVQFAAESKGWNEFHKSDRLTMGGKAGKQKVMVEGSQAYGASNTSDYPTPQESTPEETLVYLKRAMMFSMKWDGFSMESALKNGTPMDPESFEKEGLFVGVFDDLSRQIFSDGSGRLAQANGAGAGTATLVVDHPRYAKATKFLFKNRVIDIYTDAGVKEVDGIKIASVDSDTQVTLASSQSWTDNSWVYPKNVFVGSGGEEPGKGEMMGLLGFCSDANPPLGSSGGLQGLDVASYPIWKAKVYDNGGTLRAFSEDLIIIAHDRPETKVSVIFVTHGIRRKYIAYLRQFREYNTKVMWGGFSGIPFYYNGKEIPMVPDHYVPDNTMLGVDDDQITIFVTAKGSKGGEEITWEKGDAGGILQKVANKNEYVAEGHIFANLGIKKRNNFYRIDDVEE
jgi:hypothetical protein